MKIDSVVIHEIIKKEKVTGAELNISASEVDSNDYRIINMIKTLDESFSKKTLRRAKFSDDGFKAAISNFKDIDVLSSSSVLIEKLKTGIQGIPAAKGGYLVFCTYTNVKNFFAVFFVRDTKGALLKFNNDKSWDVNSTEYLDVEHFAMGAKINLDILNSDSEDRYVSLVKGNTEISEYFTGWIGLDDTKLETKDADLLYDVANQIELPEGVTRDELKKKIFEFVKGATKNIVNVRDLSKHLYGDDGYIQNYCDKNDLDIDGEFKLSGKKLARFFKVSVKAGNIELSAPRSELSPTGIELKGDVVIIHSQALVCALSEAISEKLNEKL